MPGRRSCVARLLKAVLVIDTRTQLLSRRDKTTCVSYTARRRTSIHIKTDFFLHGPECDCPCRRTRPGAAAAAAARTASPLYGPDGVVLDAGPRDPRAIRCRRRRGG